MKASVFPYPIECDFQLNVIPKLLQNIVNVSVQPISNLSTIQKLSLVTDQFEYYEHSISLALYTSVDSVLKTIQSSGLENSLSLSV